MSRTHQEQMGTALKVLKVIENGCRFSFGCTGTSYRKGTLGKYRAEWAKEIAVDAVAALDKAGFIIVPKFKGETNATR